MIRYKNDLILLFKSFIHKVDKFTFNYSNENISFKILRFRIINDFNVIFE